MVAVEVRRWSLAGGDGVGFVVNIVVIVVRFGVIRRRPRWWCLFVVVGEQRKEIEGEA